MSQFGMQMPGGGPQIRKPQPDVYTGLMLFSLIAIGAALAFVWIAGQKVGPDGNAMALQDRGSIKLADMPKP
ncbi:MAG TPA: hypothetical protein ENK11_08055 [Phycisphaerales bacterium]|nr:hypothetical protein [Phycisphaerales bacterium]